MLTKKHLLQSYKMDLQTKRIDHVGGCVPEWELAGSGFPASELVKEWMIDDTKKDIQENLKKDEKGFNKD